MQILSLWSYQQWDGADRTNHKCYVHVEPDVDFYAIIKDTQEFRYDNAYLQDLVIVEGLAGLREFMSGEAKRQAEAKAKTALTYGERKILGLKF